MEMITPEQLGLEGFPARADVSYWVIRGERVPCAFCAGCGNATFDATPYCSKCGGLMVNFESAQKVLEKEDWKHDDQGN